MISISIVIPLYNEERNISNLLNEIKNSFIKVNYEIILVDDCSQDMTINEIKKYIDKNDLKIIIIKNEFNKGQSYSISEGIKNSSYDTIVTLDGDGQNNPADISKLLTIYSNKPELSLVGGIRRNRKDSLVKKITSNIANRVRRYLLNDDCNDTGCALKIFEKETFLLFPYFDGIHRFLPALFKGYDKITYFVDVDHRKRLYGKSKYGTFKRLFRGIIDIIKVIKIIRKFKKDASVL